MHNAAPARPGPDEDTLRLARQVFQWVRAGEMGALEPLLNQGLPANLRNEQGDSLLMLAAYHGHAEVVRALLRAGADAELANDRGQTPLAGASFKGYLDVVLALLDGGAAVQGHGPDGRTALFTAAMFNRLEVVRLLLDRGADPTHRDLAGVNAREAAQKMGAEDAAEMLAPA